MVPDGQASRHGHRAAAAAAFSARYPNPAARAERLPMHRPLKAYPPEVVDRVAALHQELDTAGWSWHPPAKPQPSGRHPLRRSRHSFQELDEDDANTTPLSWRDRLGEAALYGLTALMFVGFFAVWVIGFVTAVRWIWD